DKIIALDDEGKKFQLDLETLQSKVNISSKTIGQLIAKGQKDEAENAKKMVAAYKLQISDLNDRLGETEKHLLDELVKLPNLPSDKVPVGKSPEDNVIVREGGSKPQL